MRIEACQSPFLYLVAQEEGSCSLNATRIKHAAFRVMNGIRYYARCGCLCGRAAKKELSVRRDGNAHLVEWGGTMGAARVVFEGGDKFLEITHLEGPPAHSQDALVRQTAEAVLAVLAQEDKQGVAVDLKVSRMLERSGLFQAADKAKVRVSANGQAIKALEKALGILSTKIEREGAERGEEINALRQELNAARRAQAGLDERPPMFGSGEAYVEILTGDLLAALGQIPSDSEGQEALDEAVDALESEGATTVQMVPTESAPKLTPAASPSPKSSTASLDQGMGQSYVMMEADPEQKDKVPLIRFPIFG